MLLLKLHLNIYNPICLKYDFVFCPIFGPPLTIRIMIKGVLIINNHGKARIAKFYQSVVSSWVFAFAVLFTM